MKRAWVILTVMLGVLVNTAFSQKPAVVADNDSGWKRIGQVTASFKKQNESISVWGADEFTALKLKVSEAPISIERVQVFYESGDMEEIKVSKQLQAGGETQALKLKEPYRDIQKVAFTYKTLPNSQGEKADLELFGLKTGQKDESDSYIEKKAEEVDQELDEAEAETREEAKETERELEKDADEAETDVEQAAEETGDAVSETAAKVMADIKDKKHQTKCGPNGQTIFITDDGRYYYINNEGNKVFVTELQLKDKPKDKKKDY